MSLHPTDIFDSLFDEENIIKVYEGEIADRGGAGMDRLSPERFERQKERHLNIIERKCKDGSYKFTPYKQVLKSKGRKENPRVISIPTVRDRIVLYILKDFLHVIFDDCVNRTLPNQFIEELDSYMNSIEGQNIKFYRADIESFYGSIDHNILEEKIKDRIKNSDIMSILFRAIKTPTVPKNYKRENIERYEHERGIPQGLSISNILAEIYLSGMDSRISDHVDFYKRYVDDIIIFDQNRDIDSIKGMLRESLMRRGGLSLNCDKSHSDTVSNELQFLGYVFKDDKITVRQKSVDKYIKSIADMFTNLRGRLEEPGRGRDWLSDEAMKDIFVRRLNAKLTGAISEDRRYGWIFYYLEIDDEELLHRIDAIVESFFERHPYFDKKPDQLKRVARAYWEAQYRPRNGYILNYDSHKTIGDKIDFLRGFGILDPDKEYSSDEIERIYNVERDKHLSRLKADAGTLS